MLTDELLDRLGSRAADPRTRTDGYVRSEGRSHFGGAFQTHTIHLDGTTLPDPPPLPAPATAAEVAAAERRLGIALPADLKPLYLRIANGGFGPGDGLSPLDRMADRNLALRAAPQGMEGENWPSHLLQITQTEPGADCYDLRTGEIVFWDEELLAEDEGREVWATSFRIVAANLGDWLEDWLARPAMSDQLDRTIDEGMRQNLRQTLAHWRAMTPEQRAEFGLSEEGWEEE